MSPTIAEMIRTGRIRKGWKMSQLAAQAGVSRTTLHHMERGSLHDPRAETLHKVARALDLDPQSFVATGSGPASGSRNGGASEFDWRTNTAVSEAVAAQPEIFTRFRAEDWDDLVSCVGVGGGLTTEGVVEAARRIQSDRETMDRLRIVLQTHLRGPAQQLVDALFQSVLIPVAPGRPVCRTRMEPHRVSGAQVLPEGVEASDCESSADVR